MFHAISRLFRPKLPPLPERAAIRDAANLEVVLPWALARAGSGIRFPTAYVEFLRSCLELRRCTMTAVKSPRDRGTDGASPRFAALLTTLAGLPPLAITSAEALAATADPFWGNGTIVESGRWSGDVRSHFEMSSSLGHKGRIVATIARGMRARRCLELGTAYGMSALFILEALSELGDDVHLTTVEGCREQYTMASELLAKRHPGRVTCELGFTSDVLPRLAKTLAPVDFMFHDAGHSKKDYVEDFRASLPMLAAGAVVLFDDINWNDPRFATVHPHCHKGWLEVTAHPRVRWAVEIDQDMGLLLLD